MGFYLPLSGYSSRPARCANSIVTPATERLLSQPRSTIVWGCFDHWANKQPRSLWNPTDSAAGPSQVNSAGCHNVAAFASLTFGIFTLPTKVLLRVFFFNFGVADWRFACDNKDIVVERPWDIAVDLCELGSKVTTAVARSPTVLNFNWNCDRTPQTYQRRENQAVGDIQIDRSNQNTTILSPTPPSPTLLSPPVLWRRQSLPAVARSSTSAG